MAFHVFVYRRRVVLYGHWLSGHFYFSFFLYIFAFQGRCSAELFFIFRWAGSWKEGVDNLVCSSDRTCAA